ncbi:MAG: DNA primase [Bacteroidales bacterium]
MIDRATIDRILDVARIEEVISDFVSLKKRGANYVACCPFHHEKTPSFSVSPAKGVFKCFGCGKAGSVVSFVMEHEQMSYVEALKYLGQKYGIEVKEKEESAEDVQQRLHHESLLIVNDFAQKFYTKTLWEHPQGQSVGLSYFKERGFTDDTIKKFQLGYSLDERRTFTHQAQRAGYKKEHMVEVGLTIEREETGELFDRFHERVMFPIRGISGKVIAFGGRKLRGDKEIAKYINSPESEVYVKNKVLYGIYEAKGVISREQKCYLVEGYTDVISFHQAGIENVVASSGTSLTTGQIQLIKRFTNRVTVLYDGDWAGIKASLRGIDMLLEEGLEIRVALFPDNEDPDSFARKHTAEQIRDFLKENEEDFIAFKYKVLSRDIERDPMQRARLIGDVVNSIAMIPDAITRSVYVEDTSARLQIDTGLLQQEVAKIRQKRQSDAFYARQRESERQERLQQGGFGGFQDGAGGYPEQGGAGSFGAGNGMRGGDNGLSGENSGYPGQGAAGGFAGGNGLSGSFTNAVQQGGGADYARKKADVPGFVVNTYCEEAEKEILYYLLKFGFLPIHLEEEFVYGAQPDQEQTVAQYILAQLQNDELELQNLVYKGIFDEYYRLKEHEGERILRYFMNHQDLSVSKIVVDLLAQPYTITIQKFTKSMIPEKNVLGKVVPKAILLYKAKVTAQAAMNLTVELQKAQKENNAQVMSELIEQLNTLMQVRNVFSKELNRITF